jgi:hypothetical protein
VLQGNIVFLKGCAKLGKKAESLRRKAKSYKYKKDKVENQCFQLYPFRSCLRQAGSA